MAKRNFIITVILMLLIVTSTSFAQTDKYQWKLVDTKDECQLYTSVVPGKDYVAAKTIYFRSNARLIIERVLTI
jgi:hypothetical protein